MIERIARPADILVIDDNEIDVDLLRDALERLPLETNLHHAPDGQAALDRLKRLPPHEDDPRPDLILLDLNMPGLDGRDVLERMQDDEDMRRIPVIVLSSSSADQDVTDSYDRLANGYLVKPAPGVEPHEVWGALSSFWLSLVKTLPVDPDVPARLRDRGSSFQIVRDCPVRVLYVEDNPVDAEAFVDEAAGWFVHPVEVVESAEAALARLRGGPPQLDVLVLDLNLPGTSGLELLETIRADPSLRRIQVVAFTSDERDETVKQAWARSVNAFVPKPDHPNELFRIVLGIAHWYHVVRIAPNGSV